MIMIRRREKKMITVSKLHEMFGRYNKLKDKNFIDFLERTDGSRSEWKKIYNPENDYREVIDYMSCPLFKDSCQLLVYVLVDNTKEIKENDKEC